MVSSEYCTDHQVLSLGIAMCGETPQSARLCQNVRMLSVEKGTILEGPSTFTGEYSVLALNL